MGPIPYIHWVCCVSSHTCVEGCRGGHPRRSIISASSSSRKSHETYTPSTPASPASAKREVGSNSKCVVQEHAFPHVLRGKTCIGNLATRVPLYGEVWGPTPSAVISEP